MRNKEYPFWCQIDAYDDMGARSSKRQLQGQYDKNPICKRCKKRFREHITGYGTGFKLGHLFGDVKKEYDYLCSTQTQKGSP